MRRASAAPRLAPVSWFFQTLPQTFRRHIRAFYLSVAITVVGCAFGGLALVFDPESRHVTMAFRPRFDDPGRTRAAGGASCELTGWPGTRPPSPPT